ncbi:Threonylcarbamoyl-AMP synthase [Halomicronema hongdechloris C2206]|uniref:Threonylcarbamoyl-AMP synthase n=1 Tax=Halomicronema hongdechloris C2206 TaxID=1641165 RepID=A0A1Z3HP08_9CYAN|nr:L-threonylcarbamoyladenylate synthase [Halomicronema hongdechloris]ASC72039.1 Threonylcarbamoyl-AMP synthase [Halomicronema hongdechloris C2206]
MATVYKIHPDNPQSHKIQAVKDALDVGAIVLYPTDTVYAIGCSLTVKAAIQRVRQLKQLANDKPLTFLCSSLSNIADYAFVSDTAYRIIRHLIPGPYTFLLPATKQVPKLVMSPKRRTTGIRVPNSTICHALLESLQTPIISTSALSLMPLDHGSERPTFSKASLFDHLEKQVDLIVDNGQELTYQVSSILDLTEAEPTLVRQGLGWEEVSNWGVLS